MRHLLRFIPTHVGNTIATIPRPNSEPVHPHTRGEHKIRNKKSMGWYGSSPHTWGTRTREVDCIYPFRFIPTHVGNTVRDRLHAQLDSVHPHTRGEHRSSRHPHEPQDGSSPHTWGTRANSSICRRRRRFIPTHVGNTPKDGFTLFHTSVHPHTRGEHDPMRSSISPIVGSSPHTWGTLSSCGSDYVIFRFIPTHVGNTPD